VFEGDEEIWLLLRAASLVLQRVALRDGIVLLGERDRPGRSHRRPADGTYAPEVNAVSEVLRPLGLVGGTPTRARETHAIPKTKYRAQSPAR